MRFSGKLKKAMQELGINQVQVAAMTGKSKGAVSMWLSNKTEPPQKVQADIAMALGLAADYFEAEDSVLALTRRAGEIEVLTPTEVGRLMRMNHCTIEAGLRQGVFPWGYAIKTSEKRYRYFINAKRFAEIEGVRLPIEGG